MRGRKSGEWRTVPVNLLTIDGTEYLVAPRGETQWVRNIRVAGGGELRVGRKVAGLRRHRAGRRRPRSRCCGPTCAAGRWRSACSSTASSADSTDEEIAAIAPKHPVFLVTPTT